MTEISVSLANHEKAIDEALVAAEESFVVIGKHLAMIRDGGLYKESHGSFEKYIKDRWSYSRSHAYRLIDASRIFEEVSPRGDIAIENAQQTRELAKAPTTEIAQQSWNAAVDEAGGGPPKATAIAKIVDKKTKELAACSVKTVTKPRTVQDILAEQRAKNLPTPETIAIDDLVAGLVKLHSRGVRMIKDLHAAIDAKAKSTTKMATMTVSLKKKVDLASDDLDEFEVHLLKLAESWSGNRKQVDDLA